MKSALTRFVVALVFAIASVSPAYADRTFFTGSGGSGGTATGFQVPNDTWGTFEDSGGTPINTFKVDASENLFINTQNATDYIVFSFAETNEYEMTDDFFSPANTSDISLGTSGQEWNGAFFRNNQPISFRNAANSADLRALIVRDTNDTRVIAASGAAIEFAIGAGNGTAAMEIQSASLSYQADDFKFYGATADGSDDQNLAICAGGDGAGAGCSTTTTPDGTSGGVLQLTGNEDTRVGQVWLRSGNVSGTSDINIMTTHASASVLIRGGSSGTVELGSANDGNSQAIFNQSNDNIYFYPDGATNTNRFGDGSGEFYQSNGSTISYAWNAAGNYFYGGNCTTAGIGWDGDTNTGFCRPSDEVTRHLAGGVSVFDTSTTGVAMGSGAQIFMDDASVSEPGIALSGNPDTGLYEDPSGNFAVAFNGAQAAGFGSSGFTVNQNIFPLTNGTPLTLRASTSDGSDNRFVELHGGGAQNYSGTRGAYIQVSGNEQGNAGDVIIVPGNANLAAIELRTYAANNTAVRFMNQTNGGDAVLRRWVTAEITGMSGATATASNLIPTNSQVYGCLARVTTEITGATSFDIGDGSDVDRWGAGIALTAGTTTNQLSFTANPAGWNQTATSVVLTANGSSFTAGAVRILCAISDFWNGPTS